ncbi:MAG TPA: FAD binding domain-containing protein [Candidatus Limnocylindria bacterium]|nr:FAD binding domain-containing protein [Candidatus Limnocylindria bacterium]
MFPAAFDYHRVGSIDEALSLLREHGGDARVLAGGQSLIPAMRYRLARPAVLVDINGLDDLAYVREDEDALAVGALARDATLEMHPLIHSKYPLLADTSAVVADPVVRQMGTVVGSLCHNDPAGDWAVAALAAHACVVVRGSDGARVVPIDEFLVDSFSTAVGESELALEVRFPTPPLRTAGAYQKIERKVGDFATASAAVRVTLNDDGTIGRAGVALGAAGPKATRVRAAEELLYDARPSRELVRAAADAARSAADPAADTRGSVAFKKEMAGVLVGRALVTAFARLGVEGLR